MKIHPLLITIGLLILPSLSPAQDELERLKASYENAVSKAVEPLKTTYEKELRKLLQRHAQAGRVDDVAKVVAELKAIGVKDTADMVASKSVTPKAQKFKVEGTNWKTPTGTLFSFEAEGRGTRSFGGADATAISWKERSGKVVEATGDGSKGGNETIWFFRFVSESEAYYGNNKEDVTKPLERQP